MVIGLCGCGWGWVVFIELCGCGWGRIAVIGLCGCGWGWVVVIRMCGCCMVVVQGREVVCVFGDKVVILLFGVCDGWVVGLLSRCG